MGARALSLAVLLGLAGCGRTLPAGNADAAGGWLLEVRVAWDPTLVSKGVAVRWGAGPTASDSEVSASLRARFASRAQALAFGAQLEVLVGGRRVAAETITGDGCSGLGGLGLDPGDYPVTRLSRTIAADGASVTAGPTVCQRDEGPTGLAIDGGHRTLSYVLRGLASPLAATFAGANLLPRSVTFDEGAADVELVVRSDQAAPASAVRGPLQVSLGGEAAGGITASFDACLALPQATTDVTLQVQDLLVSGGAVSLGRSLFCCFGGSCVGVVK